MPSSKIMFTPSLTPVTNTAQHGPGTLRLPSSGQLHEAVSSPEGQEDWCLVISVLVAVGFR